VRCTHTRPHLKAKMEAAMGHVGSIERSAEGRGGLARFAWVLGRKRVKGAKGETLWGSWSWVGLWLSLGR
jgi:hypothetical protein